ncbi:MAG TPA: hypothetical protein VFI48_14155 [Hyphomicrobiaceae bacterium]|nr:hypothetical protein [Hyphomicrobiaceae bacterium]
MLQSLDAPGAAFDIILAIPKPQGAIFEFSESPDALVVHLIGGELALGFEDAETMLKAARTPRRPLAARSSGKTGPQSGPVGAQAAHEMTDHSLPVVWRRWG